MHLVAVAWMYVVLMMAVAEATAANGTLLGAFFTLLLYGLLPLGIVLYIMSSGARRRARQRLEASAAAPHRSEHPSGGALPAERKEP
jgi:uncharacterized protein (DUF2062 family)